MSNSNIEETDQLQTLKVAVEIITERIRADLLNFRYTNKQLAEVDEIISSITSTMRLTHNYIQYHLVYMDSDPRVLLEELVRFNDIKLPMANKREKIENLIMTPEELSDLELNADDFNKEYAEKAAEVTKVNEGNEVKSTRKRTKRA
jgi:hypothetical protein